MGCKCKNWLMHVKVIKNTDTQLCQIPSFIFQVGGSLSQLPSDRSQINIIKIRCHAYTYISPPLSTHPGTCWHTHAQGHTLIETDTIYTGSQSQHTGSMGVRCLAQGRDKEVDWPRLTNLGENRSINRSANLPVIGRPTLTTELPITGLIEKKKIRLTRLLFKTCLISACMGSCSRFARRRSQFLTASKFYFYMHTVCVWCCQALWLYIKPA